MITLLHGDHIDASRKELQRIRNESKDKEVRLIDGKTIDETALVQSIESSSLFGNTTVVIIEQLFGKLGKQTKRAEALISHLKLSAKTSDIVLWEDKEIGATIIKMLGDSVRIRLFKLPVLIFQFLDNFLHGNASRELQLFKQLTKSEAPELIFSMLVKRVRQLIEIKNNVTPIGVSSWQMNRLTNQTKSFTMEQLVDLYAMLHDMEVNSRSGLTAFTTKQQLALFLSRL